MTNQKKAAPGEGTQLSRISPRAGNDNDSKTQTKRKRVLSELIAGKSFNRFEAERHLHDHVLPTTVADLQALGITIARRLETVPGYRGLPTKVCRYWIAPADRRRAKQVLERLR